MRPEAHSPGNPGPFPPAPTFRESKDQNPQKSCELSGYTPYTHRPRHQSPTFIGGKRENIQKAGAGGVLLISVYFPLRARGGLWAEARSPRFPFPDPEGCGEQGAPLGWSVVEGVGGIT